MNRCSVRAISAEETIELRWAILRPGYPRETAIFEGDEMEETRHFGCFAGEELQGVASIYRAPLPGMEQIAEAWQLRGMAVRAETRGCGYGRALLRSCELEVRLRGGEVLWCNARRTAAEFYRKNGFTVCGEEFEIPTVGPHFRMYRLLKS